ncbi:uncharacterized protein LOC126237269 [Schistocerca nitens]|uniref:uncharacterized protein LOC126237269 n=1 Tax=Schistocerca nitens TaxID=7011 RepID=UPI0021185AAA|nr:uncharacterized protein LOC126237269 [Schistocerca nitens]
MSYVLVTLSCVLLVLSAPYAFAEDSDDDITEIDDSLIAAGDGCTPDEVDDDDYSETTAATETTSASSRAGKSVRAGSKQKAHARTAAHGKAAKARTAAKKAGRAAAKVHKA